MVRILGLGTDIIEIARLKKAIDRQGQPFLDRLFTQAERDYCRQFHVAERHYAGRFCAKEAVLKAAGTGLRDGITWHDVTVINNPLGQPVAILGGELAALLGPTAVVHLSISHCHLYATATALIVDGG